MGQTQTIDQRQRPQPPIRAPASPGQRDNEHQRQHERVECVLVRLSRERPEGTAQSKGHRRDDTRPDARRQGMYRQHKEAAGQAR